MLRWLPPFCLTRGGHLSEEQGRRTRRTRKTRRTRRNKRTARRTRRNKRTVIVRTNVCQPVASDRDCVSLLCWLGDAVHGGPVLREHSEGISIESIRRLDRGKVSADSCSTLSPPEPTLAHAVAAGRACRGREKGGGSGGAGGGCSGRRGWCGGGGRSS